MIRCSRISENTGKLEVTVVFSERWRKSLPFQERDGYSWKMAQCLKTENCWQIRVQEEKMINELFNKDRLTK